MTHDELKEKRSEFVQIKERFVPKPNGWHDSEIEDEIKIIDKHLEKYE
jgi:hypothetical protein